MSVLLGIDTSNYTSSAAVFDVGSGEIQQNRRLLPVPQGTLGLRQSDAVFAHVKQLGDIVDGLLRSVSTVSAVGVSDVPRDTEGSYMPCFLTGVLCAQSIAAALNVKLHRFSHQAGHIAAALYSAERLDLLDETFLSVHLSGGTTEFLLVKPDAARVLSAHVVAKTLDISAGQLVDRVAGMLGLPFPGGSELEKLAAQSDASFTHHPAMKGADCCFSGVENSCARMLEKGETHADIALYCIDYVATALCAMTRGVLVQYPALPVVYAGGVMANSRIRAAIEREHGGIFAAPAFCGDNAAGTAVLCARKEGITLC